MLYGFFSTDGEKTTEKVSFIISKDHWNKYEQQELLILTDVFIAIINLGGLKINKVGNENDILN